MATIEHEREYPHSPEKVWRALTEQAHINQWFASQWGATTNDFQPIVGSSFRMEASKKTGWRGFVVGQVLEAEPPRRLVFTWIGSPQEDEEPTRVEWTLEPTASGTRLRLVYLLSPRFTGVMGWLAAKGAGASWKKMMDKALPAVLGDAPAAVR